MGARQTTESLYQQILQEHADICEMATTLLRILVERQQSSDRVSHLFTTLYERVRSHFADEEGTGMFEQIVQSVPDLAAATNMLREEHRELLVNLGQLRNRANQGELTQSRWEELEQGFREFSNQLTRHEYRENDLLHRANREPPQDGG